MNKITAVGLTLVMLAALASCGGSGGGGATVSAIEAKQAFGVSYASVLIASFALAFGQDVEGATLDEETEELTFDKFNLTEFFGEGDSDASEDIPYETVSGTVVPDGDAMTADLTLEGGPVKSIEFTLGQAEMQAESGFTTTVKINGKEMELEIGPDDFQN